MKSQSWSTEAARAVLEAAGLDVISVTPINFGEQIRCSGGVSVSVFSTGRLLCQGRDVARTKALFEHAVPPAGVPRAAPAIAPVRAGPQLEGVAIAPDQVATNPVPPVRLQGAAAGSAPASGSGARRVTDFPSTRPEDAGISPPWV